MWETIAIIVTLGGLELTLWLLERRAAKRDHEMQQKQLEILDGILTELAIQNSEDMGKTGSRGEGDEVQYEHAGDETEDRAQEHLVRH
jgi:hypothetical protein